jgi:Zn-finger nucleic acid-binding protein
MKCPVCTNIELKMTDRQGVEIDYCPDCRGIWLDRGELDKIIEKSYAQAPQPQQAAPQQTTQQPQYQHGGESNPFQKKHHDEHNPFYNKHHDKHYNEHGGGPQGQHQKKSWLSEIFD